MENSATVLLILNLIDLPLYVFLDYRYVTMNNLFQPEQMKMGLLQRLIILLALKLGEWDTFELELLCRRLLPLSTHPSHH